MQMHPPIRRLAGTATIAVAAAGFATATVPAQAAPDLAAVTAPPATVVTVEPSDRLHPVSRLLFGANHRYGYDAFGSFDPATGQVYPKLTSEVADAGISTIRYPGGTIANTFHWKQAIGPQAQRGCQTHGGTGEPLTSDYGPDEQARFAESARATDDVVVNFATGTPQEAADWVEYMNAPVGTNPGGGVAWATVRARNGHPAPYRIEDWEVGNEMASLGQSYWMGRGSTADRAEKYAFGGSTTFTDQPMGVGCDHRAAASLSTGSAHQTFAAYYPPVSPGSQTVTVDGSTWREVGDLATTDATDDVYTFDPPTGAVTFGDGVHGAVPPAGAKIAISYTSGPHGGFVDFYQAMKRADPRIHVCAGFTSTAFVQDMGDTHPYDCLQVHEYTSFSDTTTPTATAAHDIAMASTDAKAQNVATWQRQLQQAAGSNTPTVALTEYGMLRGGFQGSQAYLRSLDQGLLGASELASWIDLDLPVAMKHSLVDFEPGHAPAGAVSLIGIDQSMFGWAPSFVPAAAAEVLNLFSHMTGSSEVASQIANNPQRVAAGGSYPALKSVATADGSGHLYLVVVNRDPDRDIATQVLAQGYLYRDSAAVWTVNGPETSSYNDPEHPDVVRLTKKTVTLPESGFRYTFPAHSVTAIELTRAASVPTSTTMSVASTPSAIAAGSADSAGIIVANTSETRHGSGSLAAWAPAGWSIRYQPTNYSLEPDAKIPVKVTIGVPDGTPEGSYEVVLAAEQRGQVASTATVPIVVRNAGNWSALFTDSFDDATIGSAPPQYSVSSPGGTVAVASDPDGAGQVLTLTRAQPGATLIKAVRPFDAATDDVRLIARLRAHQAGAALGIHLLDTTGRPVAELSLAADGTVAHTDGTAFRDGPATYQPNTWYTLEAVTHRDSNSYDVYLDDVKVAHGALWPGAGIAGAVRLQIPASSASPCAFSVDELSVLGPA